MYSINIYEHVLRASYGKSRLLLSASLQSTNRETITKNQHRTMHKKYSRAERKKCLNLPEGGKKGLKIEMVQGGRSS